ncbi:hypothetical protein PROFUN_03416 [Planoprotostelium fungivorum]|uniref:DUF1206 domain-containing protein n=1 Tax=Planoprotostelium fungivorum TaxID=1890364 RepID=A0A2P6NWH1_9EUKA|nr:hypothetical protein PROFUN_03416 [Planoprotostelium fungivorum]
MTIHIVYLQEPSPWLKRERSVNEPATLAAGHLPLGSSFPRGPVITLTPSVHQHHALPIHALDIEIRTPKYNPFLVAASQCKMTLMHTDAAPSTMIRRVHTNLWTNNRTSLILSDLQFSPSSQKKNTYEKHHRQQATISHALRMTKNEKSWLPPIKKHTEKSDAVGVKLGRAGFIARGFVWACVGGVAISSAIDDAWGPQSQSGALDIVARFVGKGILIVATIGVLCYFCWRVFEFLYGIRVTRDDKGWKKIVNGYIVPLASACFYAAFAFSNIYTLAYGHRNESSFNLAGFLAPHRGGKILLSFIAVILASVAFSWAAQLIRGTIRNEFIDRRRVQRDPRGFKWALYTTGYLGIPGRIILFWLMAVLFFRCAWSKEVNNETGFGAALGQLKETREGRVLLIFDGVLLIIFGVWSMLNSRYKEFLPYRVHVFSDETAAKIQDRIEDGLGNRVGGRINHAIDRLRGEDHHREIKEDIDQQTERTALLPK